MSKYKMLVCDIDGTLLNSQSQLTRRTKEVLHKVSANGIKVTLATGRRLVNAVPIAEELGIDAPLILSNGTVIVDVLNQKTLLHKPLPKNVVERILPLLQKSELWTRLYRHSFEGIETYYDRLPKIPEAWLFTSKDPKRGQQLEYTHDSLDFDPVNIVVLDERNKVDPVIEKIQKELINTPFNLLVHHDFPEYLLLEILHHECSKASGIDFLAKQMGIERDEIIVVGDNVNDIEMVEYAGWGVAMGNAVEELKAIADEIAPANDEDGVAWLAEKYFLRVK
jgi:Cof subfamily protein (haloacid dehalogenase superfamily)